MIGLSERPETGRRSDPLLRDVLWDLLVPTVGFLRAITAVTLTLDVFSVQ